MAQGNGKNGGNGNGSEPGSPDEAQVVEAGLALPLEAQTRGEIDIQIRTARAFPRSIKQFKDEAMAMATLDEETAAGCIYALPRAGKTIEGPSVRLAEIVNTAWGHTRTEARIVEETAQYVKARAVCWDLQKNVAVGIEVRRRCTDKGGRKFSDDMVTVTCNAACAIAARNAIFKVIPNVFTKEIYQAARKVAVGDAQTLADKRAKVIEYFGKMGVTSDRILRLLGVKGLEDISLDHLATLRGLATALKDGDTTIEEAFAEANDAPATARIDLGSMKPGKTATHTEPGAPLTPPAPAAPATPPAPPAAPPAETKPPASPAAGKATDKPKGKTGGKKAGQAPTAPAEQEAKPPAPAPSPAAKPESKAQPDGSAQKPEAQPAAETARVTPAKVTQLKGPAGTRFKLAVSEGTDLFYTSDEPMARKLHAASKDLKTVLVTYRTVNGENVIEKVEDAPAK